MKGINDLLQITNNINNGIVSWISDIHLNGMVSPVFLVWLCSLINQWLIDSNWEIKWSNETISYLERSNFNKIIWRNNEACNFIWNSPNLVELTIIDLEPNLGDIDAIAQKFIVKMLGLKKDDTISQDIQNKFEDTLFMMITELISNITTHSCSDFSKNSCLYMMQYYPTTEILRLWIVDAWVWIVETFKKSSHYKQGEDDLYYMDLALKQYYTRDEALWAWNWLFMCSRIIECTKWVFEIISHNHNYKQIWQEKSFGYNWVDFPWTLINIEIKVSEVINVDMKDVLKWRNTSATEMDDLEIFYKDLW